MVAIGNRKPINYKNSFCAYLDVLGFENLVVSTSREDKDKLELYYALVEITMSYLKNVAEKSDIGVLAISDSIIISCETPNSIEDKIEKFRHFLISINIIQSTLCLHDVWIRGGVSYGNVCFDVDQKFIVGPGYINAYKLEKIAKYPRVIVDVGLVDFLGCKTPKEFINKINMKELGGLSYDNWKTNVLFEWSEIPSLKALFTQDVSLFLDYMSYCVDENQENLDEIIQNITGNIKKHMDHYDKYRWVTNYLLAKARQRDYSKDDQNEYIKKLEMI